MSDEENFVSITNYATANDETVKCFSFHASMDKSVEKFLLKSMFRVVFTSRLCNDQSSLPKWFCDEGPKVRELDSLLEALQGYNLRLNPIYQTAIMDNKA